MERYKSSTFYYRSMKSFLEEMKKKIYTTMMMANWYF